MAKVSTSGYEAFDTDCYNTVKILLVVNKTVKPEAKKHVLLMAEVIHNPFRRRKSIRKTSSRNVLSRNRPNGSWVNTSQSTIRKLQTSLCYGWW
jgi:hypothetical protein